MAMLYPGRYTADSGGEVVVFLIGMRFNRSDGDHGGGISVDASAPYRWLARDCGPTNCYRSLRPVPLEYWPARAPS